MDEKTASAFKEASRQLFDPTVEDEDIQLAEASIRRAETMRTQARASIPDVSELQKREKALDDQIASQKKWICTLKEIQGQKIQRQNGIRKIAD